MARIALPMLVLLLAPTSLAVPAVCAADACGAVSWSGDNCTGAYAESVSVRSPSANLVLTRYCAREASGVSVHTWYVVGQHSTAAGAAWMGVGSSCGAFASGSGTGRGVECL